MKPLQWSLHQVRESVAHLNHRRTPGRLALLLTLLFILAGCRPIPDPAMMAAPQPAEEPQAEEQPTAEPTPVQESRAERLLKEGAPELLWRYQPDEPEVSPEGRPLFLMRALVGGTVYVGAPDGYIHALHADSGERLWSYQAGGNVHTSPAQIDGSVFFASEDGNLYALDAASGELLWQHETDLAAYQVIAQDGFVYFNTDGSIISALDPVSGEEIWRGGIDIENLFLRTVVEGVALPTQAPTCMRWTPPAANCFGATRPTTDFWA